MKDEDIKLTREHPEAEVKHIVRGLVRRGLKPQTGSVKDIRFDADR